MLFCAADFDSTPKLCERSTPAKRGELIGSKAHKIRRKALLHFYLDDYSWEGNIRKSKFMQQYSNYWLKRVKFLRQNTCRVSIADWTEDRMETLTVCMYILKKKYESRKKIHTKIFGYFTFTTHFKHLLAARSWRTKPTDVTQLHVFVLHVSWRRS